MDITELVEHINSRFPLASALPGDRVGVHLSSTKPTVESVLVCLDITDEVVQEAIELNTDCIVAFHPLIYSPLQQITHQNRVERLVHTLIQNNIAVVVVHTAYDVFEHGTNAHFALALDLQVQNSLPSIGVVAQPSEPIDFEDLLEKVAATCSGSLRYVPPTNSMVRSIAIVCGSGFSFYEDALHSGADVFITADVKYHDMLKATGVLGIIDPGHYEMEQFVPFGIAHTLQQILPSAVRITATTVNTNPVHYFSSQQILAL